MEALPLFEKSVAYFSKNRWIDKYRFITLLSSSGLTYREMGLCNIAFCYSQTGNGLKAKEVYTQTLQEYPENGLANAGLNMLTSLEIHEKHFR
jgi:tetratricopeptide (TPR) repeat protein